ncbi:MAG: DUF2971 domain-containing protein [Pseudomonadota bacterium]
MQFDLHLEFDPDDLVRLCKQDTCEILLGKRGFEPSIGLGNMLSRLQTLTPRLPPAVLDNFLEDAFRTAIKNLPVDISRMHEELRNHFKKYNILCLSAVNDNLLMWSHYADHHRGVVIRLACLEETDSSWSVAEPIVYSKSMPRLVDQNELRDLFTGRADLQRESIVKRTILTKAWDWQYEQEWRVADFSKKMSAEFVNFHPLELAAIYFGCKSDVADRDAILSRAKSINPAVQAFLAKKSERAFGLEFAPLT